MYMISIENLNSFLKYYKFKYILIISNDGDIFIPCNRKKTYEMHNVR